MLQLKPKCETCERALPPESAEAWICSFECTFCAGCVETKHQEGCPNCGGNFERRPIRPAHLLAKYPPVGNRSLGGGMHSMNFDATAGEYFEKANDEILVILQTESPRGADNAEEIYALPGVDAIFVAPVDLRANRRKPG